jgi:hypothetical protein
MPYASNRDRSPTELELTHAPWPLPPLNVFLTSAFHPGVYDLRWEDPSQLSANSRFILTGVNVYRSFDSEYGPFERVTEMPIGSTFWRDRTDTERVVDEDVSGRFVLFGRKDSATGSAAPRYVFKTLYDPIVKSGSQGVFAHEGSDVKVFVDGMEARVLRVYGRVGEVEIDAAFPYDPTVHGNNAATFEPGTQTYQKHVIPREGSRVTCSYVRLRHLVRTDLANRIFYRFTTVGIPVNVPLSVVQATDLVETPLEEAASTSNFEIEKLDYIWREAIRRNRFILEQGGERVRVLLQKNNGIPCPCIQDDYHGQPMNDCRVCFGASFIGGYDGPYDIIMAPDDGEKKIRQSDIGRTVEHGYDVFTGPSPLMRHRDFIVKINGDRYSVGAVRMPSNRGMILQQHFTIGHIDEKDIRYRVPMDSPVKYPAVEFKPGGPEHEAEAEPTFKPEVPEEEQLKGRSPCWANIEF